MNGSKYETKNLQLQASESYQGALRLLAKRAKCAEIWDSISWELSSTYFNMATLMQDYAPLAVLAQEQVLRLLIFNQER